MCRPEQNIPSGGYVPRLLARAHTFAIDGLEARHIAVEVDVRSGLPAFALIGPADAGARHARERVRAALLNSGFAFPPRRVTASIAPAGLRHAGPGIDLALACALLAATGQIPAEALDDTALLGELALDGDVRSCAGTLAAACAARACGISRLVVAATGAREATGVAGLRVAGVHRLSAAVRVLLGGRGDPLPPPGRRASPARGPDLADVRGQDAAVRALLIAAAGGHGLLIAGPAGSGKTMLARRLPSLLPPLAPEQALDAARAAALAGQVGASRVVLAPPFRAPHPAATAAALLGSRRGGAGDLALAHHGVLFLDELGEFSPGALQAVRRALDERSVPAPGSASGTLPARFQLLATARGCPCGAVDGACACSAVERERLARRLAPLLARVEIACELGAGGAVGSRPADSAAALALVRSARRRQATRTPGLLNAELEGAELARTAGADGGAVRALGALAAREHDRALRVARTIADLEASARVRAAHVREASTLIGAAAGRHPR